MQRVLRSISDGTKLTGIKSGRYLCMHCDKQVAFTEKQENKKYFYHPEYKLNCRDDGKEQQYAIHEFEPIKVRNWDTGTINAAGDVLWYTIIGVGFAFWLNK